jgi:conjugal transfer pilus assembly protein TraW
MAAAGAALADPSGTTVDAAAEAIATEARALDDWIDMLDLDALLPGAQEPDATTLSGARAIASDAAALLAAEIDRRAGHDSKASEAAPDPATARYVVFASRAMGAGELAALAALAEVRGDMAIFYRGLGPGERLADFAERVARDGHGAAIDPRAFREHGVTAVPALLDTATGVLVHGVIDPTALEGRTGGEVLGPLVAVAEPDLIEVLQSRLAAIDWASRREAAVARFWSRAPFVALEPARAPHIREVDARVRLAEDFELLDGVRVAEAGALIDPTALRPLTLTLIVFDGTRPAEFPVVEAAMAEAARPVLITTGLDRLEGWEAHAALEARLGAPVHLLTADLAERLDLRRTVSVVTAGRGVFIVDERPAGLAEAADTALEPGAGP